MDNFPVPAADAPPGLKIEILDDGTPIDAESGEVLDPASPEVIAAVAALPVERFAVDSEDAAEWVLEKRAEVESEVAALTQRRDAILANFDAMLAQRRRRLQWWEFRFASDLVGFARRTLGKGKTRQFAHGKVSFRATPGSTAILDDAAALAFVRAWRPDLIKVVESVNVTAVKAAIAAANAAVEGDDYSDPPWLKTSGPGESVKIETGVGLAAPKPRKGIA